MKVKPSSPVHRDHVRSFCGNVKSICGSMMFCENCRFFTQHLKTIIYLLVFNYNTFYNCLYVSFNFTCLSNIWYKFVFYVNAYLKTASGNFLLYNFQKLKARMSSWHCHICTCDFLAEIPRLYVVCDRRDYM